MLQMIWGARVHCADRLDEGYETNGQWLHANVNADHIRTVFDAFLEAEGEVLYSFFMEVPATIEEEQKLQNTPQSQLPDPTHINVYYHDGLSKEDIIAILDAFGGILTKDGLTSYGIISEHDREIGKYKYNVMKGYCQTGDLTPLTDLMNRCGIKQTEKLYTAWDYFTEADPGICTAYRSPADKTVYDVVDWLLKNGMYKAKTIEEPTRNAAADVKALQLFLEYCAQLCRDQDYADRRSVERHNAAMKKLNALAEEIPANLLPLLLQNDDETVRLNAATFCLQKEVHAEEARQTLNDLAANAAPSIRFEASTVLKTIK